MLLNALGKEKKYESIEYYEKIYILISIALKSYF